jgi:hypothetical protein
VVLALACLVAPMRPLRAQEVVDRVMAVVAGQAILASDVSVAVALGLVSIEPSSPDAARVALSQLVDRALILVEVERYAPPEPEDGAVTGALEAVRSRFATPAAFAAALARGGLEESHLRERLRQDLRIAAYLDQRFIVTQPTEEEVAEIYRRELTKFMRDGIPASLDEVRPEIVSAIVDERRTARIEEWVAGLRRRTPVVLYY